MGFIDFDIYVRGRAREALQEAIKERGLCRDTIVSLRDCWELIIGRITERFAAIYDERVETLGIWRNHFPGISYNRYAHCVCYCRREAKRIIRQMFGRAWV